MRNFFCRGCLKTTSFLRTGETETLQSRVFRLFVCELCCYRLHVEEA